jgi:hypothetical protein
MKNSKQIIDIYGNAVDMTRRVVKGVRYVLQLTHNATGEKTLMQFGSNNYQKALEYAEKMGKHSKMYSVSVVTMLKTVKF